tara:strand:- start:118 stop:492 length:375 start_codon:yes stop_codon:yes gene_type:complete
MAYSESATVITLPASADLSASQYCFVSVNTSGEVELSGDDGNPVGILQNKPSAQGRAAEVLIAGVSKIKSGVADFDAGYNAASGASGKGKRSDTASFRLGIIIETASADGEFGTMVFSPNGKVA